MGITPKAGTGYEPRTIDSVSGNQDAIASGNGARVGDVTVAAAAGAVIQPFGAKSARPLGGWFGFRGCREFLLRYQRGCLVGCGRVHSVSLIIGLAAERLVRGVLSV